MARLETAGLLAEPGDFEKVLDQIVTNLVVPSNLTFSRPVKVRILLTLPVEATMIDHTILLSKGLIDTIPDEEALASVIALELAHVELGHQVDTMFAFNDKLAFTNDATYLHLPLHTVMRTIALRRSWLAVTLLKVCITRNWELSRTTTLFWWSASQR